MLYQLSQLTDWYSPLNVFRYVTFRALGGAATAFLICIVVGPWMIAVLRRLKLGQPNRMGDAPKLQAMHNAKAGTPTMGGLLIILAALASTVLWAMPGNRYVLLALATMAYMGAIGFWDDYLKVSRLNPRGLSARFRLALQTLWAVAFVFLLWQDETTRRLVNDIMVPFVKAPVVAHAPFAVALVFIFLVLVGSANAVNLTDGLDGLAVGCTNAVALAYLIMSYIAGHALFAGYLQVPHVPGASELAVFCGCLLGAGMGFLWFNCHPARVFMGDTGSLAIGGAIAVVAILIQQEITLVIVGGVFVMEALSVLVQVAFFKATGRRVFRCAPLHHHFEILGKERAVREGRDQEVVETMVTTRFWILSIIFALVGVATLKIR
jgi:phospho-N-acetylmuramoyl-pentapeptide-transferase